MVDYFNQTVTDTKLGSGVLCQIGMNASEDLSSKGAIAAYTDHGYAFFNTTSFSGLVDVQYHLKITCRWSRSLESQVTEFKKNYDVAALHVQCDSGYFTTVFNSQYTVCQLCEATTYSTLPGSFVCTPCMVGATCNGGDDVSCNPGYWKNDSLPTEVLSCAFGGGQCAGEDGGAQLQSGAKQRNMIAAAEEDGCIIGYEGIVCGVCSEGYAWTGTSCDKCNSTEPPMGLMMLLVGVFAIGLVGYQT